jgi:GTP cyclohydrolase I
MSDPTPPVSADPHGRPMSEVIRERIQAAKRRFHANDNIAEFIHGDVEIKALEAEVSARIEGVLRSLVIDTENDHNSHDTSSRVARMYMEEVFSGRYRPMPKVTEFPNAEKINELMIIGPVTVRSACSHHLVPIIGRLWIGVMPGEGSQLIGLSKYARIAEWVMSRPQIQEEAVMQLADLLESRLKPAGIALVLSADHFCMQWRGVKDDEPHMTNSVMRGAFLESEGLRREFLQLLKL